jgi:hypothetical protein
VTTRGSTHRRSAAPDCPEPGARSAGWSRVRSVALAGALAIALGGCVPAPPTPSPSPTPAPTATPVGAAIPAGWAEHPIAPAGVSLALPADWLVFEETDLDDPAVRAELERDFEGARTLFGTLGTGERSARIAFLGVDPRARGTGRFTPSFAVIAVEPALPPLLLEIGTGFALDALEENLVIETEMIRSSIDTPVGPGVRVSFDHRVVPPAGGRGVLVAQDGALTTTGETSFLVSRNVDPRTAPGDTPTLDTVLGSLRLLP